MIRLEEASQALPLGLKEFLQTLGAGENGFQGTPVATGESSVEEYVEQCRGMTDPAKVPPGLVPQTVFWVVDDTGTAIGMLRVRHCLNERLRRTGGHIGYYIRPDQRGRGYAKEALRLALGELHKLGERQALITPRETNTASVRVVEANGGRLENAVRDPETGTVYLRYWVDLEA